LVAGPWGSPSRFIFLMGALELGGSPDDFRKLIADETEKWGNVIRFAHISAD
jgi:hypothetical protein